MRLDDVRKVQVLIDATNLTPEHRCVLANAIEEAGLSSILNDWKDWSEDELPTLVLRLGDAVIQLAELGAIEAVSSDAGPRDAVLSLDEIQSVVENRKAWWNGNEDLESVIWVLLTDAGSELVSLMSTDDLYSYKRCHGAAGQSH